MIAVFIVTVCILATTLMWALVKTASDADKRLDELYQAFLLGEEREPFRKSSANHIRGNYQGKKNLIKTSKIV